MLTVTHKNAYWVMPPAIKSVPYAQLNRLTSTSLERRGSHANLEQIAVVPHLRSHFVKHQRGNRCSSSMPWIHVQELSQQYWPLLLVTVMHTFLRLLLLSYLWYSPILEFRRVVLHMHQFAFFPFPLYCPLVSLFSCRHWFRCSTEILRGSPVRVCFVIQITGFTRYKVPRTNAGVGILLLVQGPPCVSSRATNRVVSYSDREFSSLGALSRMVSERTLPPFSIRPIGTPHHSKEVHHCR